MKIAKNELTGKNADMLYTELMYFVSAARALKYDLVSFTLKIDSQNETVIKRRTVTVSRLLQSLKKKKYIQLAVRSDVLNEPTTETEYLFNKYPDLLSNIGEELCYIVKL